MQFVVTCPKGFEELLSEEIQSITTLSDVAIKPGQVLLEAELQDAYKICLYSRLANRVLLKLAERTVRSADDLYQLADAINWSAHFDAEQTFIVDFHGTDQVIKNSQFGAVRIKDAVVDQFSRKVGSRPFIDKQLPSLRIHARLHRQLCQLFIDLSGQSLHQRHYRQATGDAPIKEHLAAAMLLRSGWCQNTDKPLYDPMCGSGTIAIEAALLSANKAPGLQRQIWGFGQWKGHQEAVWETLVEEAKQNQTVPSVSIYASDLDPEVIKIAQQNAQAAGVADLITFSCADATSADVPTSQSGYIVSNPPYGERLSDMTSLLPVYRTWGQQLKRQYADWHVAILSSNRDLLRQLKLAANKYYQFMNGKLECQLALYTLDDRNCEEKEEQQNSDFANRLQKNLQRLKKWIKQTDSNCYRIYDSDLPEYNVAIDRYDDWLVVQEYAAPKNVPEAKTRQRLMDVLIALPSVTGVPSEHIVMKVREQQKGKQQYKAIAKRKEFMQVHENGASFWVNLHDYLDTGLFLDHRITRQLVQNMSRSKQVLNLFSYTGSVSVHAALGGASRVVTVDMSKTYLDWAKRNFSLNKISGPHRFEQADCLQWLKRSNDKFDLIFIDPPSFSNSKRMDNVWDVQRDHVALLKDARRLLNQGGKIIFSNNLRRFKLDNAAIEAMGLSIEDWCSKTLPEDFKRNPKIHHCWLLRDC